MLAGRVIGRFLIINGLIATSQANGLWMLLFNILRHKAHVGRIITLIFVSVDGLTIVGFTNNSHIILQTPIREEGRRTSGRGGRTRQSTRSHRDIGEELGLLIGEPTLLQELLIFSGQISLLSGLLLLTSLHLGRCTLQSRTLRPCTKSRNLLARLHLTGKIRCHNALLALRVLNGLLVVLNIQRRNSLSQTKGMLAGQISAFEGCTVATVGTRTNSICRLLRTFLTLLLLKSLYSRIDNSLNMWVLILSYLFIGQTTNILRTAQREASRRIIIGLRCICGSVCACDTSLLGWRHASNKLASILLEWLGSNIFGSLIYSLIPRHNLWRDFGLLGGSRAAATHISVPLPIRSFHHRGKTLRLAFQTDAHKALL